MKGYGVYKMMIQSTILQNSSINAVPDHFIKAIVASECIFSSVVPIFQYFWRFFLFMFVCFPSVFSSKTFFQEQSSEFPWCFLQKFRVLVFIKCSFPCSTPQNQQSFATVALYNPPGLLWQGYGVYKMMIQSTILQTSSINAVPDHFIKAIVASERILSSVCPFFQCFWRFFVFLFMFVCFPSVFSSKTFFQEQSSEFPWCFLDKLRFFGVYEMQFSMQYPSKPAIFCHSCIL